MDHPDAPDGKALKYSLPERERRFVLDRVPGGEIIRTVTIDDLYISGTRLRVRKIVDRGRETYKFTQKIPHPDGRPGLITTLYVNAAEHALLSTLPGEHLRKTRHSIAPMGIDVFEGELEGLLIAEAEFTSDEEMAAFVVPFPVIAEVTDDSRFTGGSLVRTTRSELRAALASIR